MIKKYIERIVAEAMKAEMEEMYNYIDRALNRMENERAVFRKIATDDSREAVQKLDEKLTELADGLLDAERNISDHEGRLDDIERSDIPELNSDIDDLRERIEELERAASKFDNVRKSVYDIAENIRAAMSEIMEEVEG